MSPPVQWFASGRAKPGLHDPNAQAAFYAVLFPPTSGRLPSSRSLNGYFCTLLMIGGSQTTVTTIIAKSSRPPAGLDILSGSRHRAGPGSEVDYAPAAEGQRIRDACNAADVGQPAACPATSVVLGIGPAVHASCPAPRIASSCRPVMWSKMNALDPAMGRGRLIAILGSRRAFCPALS